MADLSAMFVNGRFQHGAEDKFPFSSINEGGVWYVLFGVRDGRVVGEGFSATIQDLTRLCEALESGDSKTLIGVWTGSYNTDLFPLESAAAARKIRSALAAREAEKNARAAAKKAPRRTSP